MENVKRVNARLLCRLSSIHKQEEREKTWCDAMRGAKVDERGNWDQTPSVNGRVAVVRWVNEDYTVEWRGLYTGWQVSSGILGPEDRHFDTDGLDVECRERRMPKRSGSSKHERCDVHMMIHLTSRWRSRYAVNLTLAFCCARTSRLNHRIDWITTAWSIWSLSWRTSVFYWPDERLWRLV